MSLNPGQFINFTVRITYDFSNRVFNTPKFNALIEKQVDVALGKTTMSKAKMRTIDAQLEHMHQIGTRCGAVQYILLPRARITTLFRSKEMVRDLNEAVAKHMKGLVPVFTQHSLQSVRQHNKSRGPRESLKTNPLQTEHFILTYRCKLKGKKPSASATLFDQLRDKLFGGVFVLPYISSFSRGRFRPAWVSIK
jgi:hypothetical protein